MTDQDEIQIDLSRLFQALWNRIVIIILIGLLTAGCFLGYTIMFIPPQYSSTALLYVNSSNLSLAGSRVSISTQELSAAKSLVDTYIVILRTRTTLEEVVAASGLNYSYRQLGSMIEAAPVDNTEIFSVTVTSRNPAHSEILANTIAQQLPNRIASIVDGSSARIVDTAIENPVRVSPNTRRNAIMGFIVGFLVSCVLILVQTMLDETIRKPDDVTSKYQIPILAVIPDLSATKSRSAYYGNSKRESR